MKTAMHIVAWLLLIVAPTAPAQRAILDDAPSPRQVYDLDLGWQPQEIMRSVQALLSDQDASLPPLSGFLPGVDIRLDTRRYVGREVRIFLRLPTAMPGTDSIGDVELSWQASGLFLAGAVSPGQETLIYEGTIDQPITGSVLDIRVSIGPGGMSDRFIIEPLYEIEIIS